MDVVSFRSLYAMTALRYDIINDRDVSVRLNRPVMIIGTVICSRDAVLTAYSYAAVKLDVWGKEGRGIKQTREERDR